MTDFPAPAIIDTHSHYNLSPLFENWSEQWQKAQEAGVTHSVIIGTDADSNQRALTLAAQNSNFSAALGYHPENFTDQSTQSDTDQNVAILADLVASSPVAAIGEVGLDYFRVDKSTQEFTLLRQQQLYAFELQLKLALTHDLPLILHVRDHELASEPTPGNAYWDVLTLMKLHWPAGKPFVLHCVSGTAAYLQAALELGAYVGVAGNVSYKSADQIRLLVSLTPPDRLLIETDAPFLPPHPHRGKPCDPWMISLTAAYLQTELQINLERCYANSQTLFPSLIQTK